MRTFPWMQKGCAVVSFAAHAVHVSCDLHWNLFTLLLGSVSARTAILAHSATIAHSTSTMFLSTLSSPLRNGVPRNLWCGTFWLSLFTSASSSNYIHIDSSSSQPFLLGPLVLFLVVSNVFLSVAQFSFQVDRASVSLALSLSLSYSTSFTCSLCPGLNLLVNGPSVGTAPWVAAGNVTECPRSSFWLRSSLRSAHSVNHNWLWCEYLAPVVLPLRINPQWILLE